MFDSIICQIKKLDKDIDLCKERLHALTSNSKNIRSSRNVPGLGKCKIKTSKFKRTRSAMERRVPAERELICKKHPKVYPKPINKVVKSKESVHNLCKKTQKVKPRSRSASCGRDYSCDCISENNYHHNDLIYHNHDGPANKKHSWANILKEHNDQTEKKFSHLSRKRDHIDCDKIIYPSSIYLKNRGVQCSDVSYFPSKSVVSGNTHFTSYDPTRTLQFLMREIRENLKTKSEDKVLSIINDMEDAVYRIKSNYDYPVSNETKYPTNFSCQPPLNNYNTKPIPSHQDINKILNEGMSKLETTCKGLEVTCARLKEENKQLSLQLQKTEASLSLMERREKESNDKIDSLNKHILMLSSKGNDYSQSIQDLSKLLTRLQEENKCIEPLKELNLRMESKLNKMNKEMNATLYENKMLLLENEKLKVLLTLKNNQLSNYKEAFYGLEDRINKEVNVIQGRCVSEESDPDSSAPLCSSPNTSASVMAPAYGSWRGVSRISSKMESARNSPLPLDHQASRSPEEVKKLTDPSGYDVHSCKVFDKPFEEPVQFRRTKEPVNDDSIRKEIKKLFSDPCFPPNAVTNNKAQQWVNLNSVQHTDLNSMTSYNTTT